MTEPKPYFVSSLLQSEPEYAGFWIRFLASFLDTLSFMVVYAIIAVTIFIIGFGNIQFAKAVLGIAKGFEGGLQLFGLVVGWLYHAFLESSEWQATLGKKMCGLRVTDLNGERLTFARATARYFGRWISCFACYVGYIMAAFTQKKQALHDMIAGTVVVKTNEVF